MVRDGFWRQSSTIPELFVRLFGNALRKETAWTAHENSHKTIHESQHNAAVHQCQKTKSPKNRRLAPHLVAHKALPHPNILHRDTQNLNFHTVLSRKACFAVSQATKWVWLSAKARSVLLSSCTCHSGEASASESRAKSSQSTSIICNFS